MIDDIEVVFNTEEQKSLFSFIDLNYKFENEIFVVPIFQRKYSWDINKIQEFIEEIEDALNEDFFKKKHNGWPFNRIVKGKERFESFGLKKSIFFGSIYLSHKEKVNQSNKFKEKMIVDGQQRIATWFIMLLCCYQKIHKNKKYYLKNENKRWGNFYQNFFNDMKSWLFLSTNNEYLNFKNLKFKTNQLTDSKTFEKMFNLLFKEVEKTDNNSSLEEKTKNIQSKKDVKKLLKTNIFQSYIAFEKFLDEKLNYLKENINEEKYGFFLSDGIHEKNDEHLVAIIIAWLFFRIIHRYKFAIFLMKPNRESIIFETINGKGTQLTALDIIKNRVYTGYHDEGHSELKFKEDFNKLEELIERCYKDLKNSDNFLLNYFKACFSNAMKENSIKNNGFNIKFVNKKRLQENFEKIIRFLKEQKCEKPFSYFMNKAKKFLETYLLFFEKTSHEKKWISDVTFGLKILNYESIKTILVALVLKNNEELNKKIDEEIIFKYVDQIYKYYLLNLTIEKKQANFCENIFKQIMFVALEHGLHFINNQIIADESEEKDLTAVIKFNNNINLYFKNEKKQQIIDNVVDNEYKENEIIKWYLYNIFANKFKENISTKDIQLEHVLPKKHDKWEKENYNDWKDEKSNLLYDNYKYRLGNCILLPADWNLKISNNLFLEKYKKIVKEMKKEVSFWLNTERNLFCDYSFLNLGEKQYEWTPQVIDQRNEIIKNHLSSILPFSE